MSLRHLPCLALLLAASAGTRVQDDEQPATIRGLVLDPQGQPVAGAQVEFRLHVGGPAWNWSAIGMQNGPDGRFEYMNLPPGPTQVIARAPGFAASEPYAIQVAPGAVIEGVELVLRPGGRLTGEVFGPDGAPDAGRTLLLQSTNIMERFGHELTADAQGFFELAGLEPGRYHLVALPDELTQPGAAPLTGEALGKLRTTSVRIRSGETTRVVLGERSRTAVRLYGHVRPARLGRRDVMLAAVREGEPQSALRATAVDPDGLYALVLDAPGPHVIVVGDPLSGEPYAEFFRTIPKGERCELDLELPRGALRGRVRDERGRGVAGVPVVLHVEDRPSWFDALGGRTVRSAADGRFAFEHLADGTYTARASVAFEGAWNPTGHAVAVSRRLRIEAGHALEGLELAVGESGMLAGVVRDERGKPVVGAVVFVRDAEGRLLAGHSSVLSGAEGRFVITHVPAGEVSACARTRERCSQESAPVKVRPGRTAEVALELEPATTLTVEVLDENGAAVRAEVRVLDELERDVGGMRDMERVKEQLTAGLDTLEQTFGPLAPGTYLVLATTPDGRRRSERVRLDGEPQHALKLAP